MKRILYILTVIIYTCISVLVLFQIRTKDFNKLVFDDYECIEVYNWNSESSIKEKNVEIEKYAIENNINILKLSYDTESDKYTAYSVDMECAIADKKAFCRKLHVQEESLSKEKWCISNRNGDGVTQVLDTYYNDGKVSYWQNTIKNENILGSYLVSKNAAQFAEDMGFKYTINDGGVINYYTIIIIGLVVLLVSIYFMSYIFYVIKKSDDVAVRRMCGWSELDIDFSLYLKKQIPMQLEGIIIALLFSILYVFVYNGGKQVGEVICRLGRSYFCILFPVIFMLFILFYISKKMDTRKVLQKGRPEKAIHILNYILKCMVTFVIVGLCTYILSNINLGHKFYAEKQKIEKTKNYAVLGLDAVYAYTDDLQKLSEVSMKCKDLFTMEEKKGGILSYYTDGDLNGKNTLFINKNYLEENEVYDTNGNRVTINNDNCAVKILIPKKYISQEQEIKLYTENWMLQQKEAEMIYETYTKNYKKTNLENVTIEYIYVKNDQKYFTYGVTEMYADNPIIFAVNENSVSKDTFLTYFVTQSYFAKMNYNENMIEEAKKDIELCGLDQEMQSVEKLVSLFSYKRNSLNNALRYIAIAFIIFVWMVVLLNYMLCQTYLQRYRLVHSVQKLHGYNFQARHFNFLLQNLLSYIPALIIYFLGSELIKMFLNITNLSYYRIVSLALCIIAGLDMLLSVTVIRWKENGVIKDALKG